jgi:hypothetical protein
MSAPPTPWSIDDFTEVTRAEGGDAAVAVLRYGLDWAESHGGGFDFISDRPKAPLYFWVPDRDGERVRVLSFRGGRVGVMYWRFNDHPPYNDEAELRDLTDRLNEIDGIDIPPGRWKERGYDVKLEFMRIPEIQVALFGAFEDVARGLSHFSSLKPR